MPSASPTYTETNVFTEADTALGVFSTELNMTTNTADLHFSSVQSSTSIAVPSSSDLTHCSGGIMDTKTNIMGNNQVNEKINQSTIPVAEKTKEIPSSTEFYHVADDLGDPGGFADVARTVIGAADPCGSNQAVTSEGYFLSLFETTKDSCSAPFSDAYMTATTAPENTNFFYSSHYTHAKNNDSHTKQCDRRIQPQDSFIQHHDSSIQHHTSSYIQKHNSHNDLTSYDPFKCLESIAEQSLTGNFSMIFDNSTTSNPTLPSHSSSTNTTCSFLTPLSSTPPTPALNSGAAVNCKQDSTKDSGCALPSGQNPASIRCHVPKDEMSFSVTKEPSYHSDNFIITSSSTFSPTTQPALTPQLSTSPPCMYNANNKQTLVNNESANFINSINCMNKTTTQYCEASAPTLYSMSQESRPQPIPRKTTHDNTSFVSGASLSCCPLDEKPCVTPSSEIDQCQAENDDFMSWTHHHPEHWSSGNVLDWLFYLAQTCGLDMGQFRGENFQAVDGNQLCRMSIEEIIALEPKFGRFIYQKFHQMLCGVVFKQPPSPAQLPANHATQMTTPTTNNSNSNKRKTLFSPPQSPFPCSPQANSYACPQVNSYQGMAAPETFFKQECYNSSVDSFDLSTFEFGLDDVPYPSTIQGQDQYQSDCRSYNPAHFSAQVPPTRLPCCFPNAPPHVAAATPRRKPGRPKIKHLIDEERRGRDKKGKHQHLWEFIHDTLMDPLYNPQFLRWENQREGVFRFVQSEAVAQLWGGRKNNENMTYEKLSRAMRHYYKRGILERVEGRRLVYKFSLKAMDRVRQKKQNSGRSQ